MHQSSESKFFFDGVDKPDDQHTFWIKSNAPCLRRLVLSSVKLFEGTLFIKSKKSDFWRSRFFLLFSDRLELYKNGRDKQCVATMLLTNLYLDLEYNDPTSLSLTSQGKRQIFNARSPESREKWLVHLRQTCVLSNYKENYFNLAVLGKGKFAKVLLAERNSDKVRFAVKTFRKSNLLQGNNKQRISLINEISILRKCDHPNIIKLYEIYETQEFIYLVMEMLEGGELFQKMIEKAIFSEKMSASILHKILNALNYLHSKNIMHRDLKPENILLKDMSDNFDLKLADFGLAATTLQEPQIKRCGTPGYVAPEILDDLKYDQKVDVFSAGVILHTLLTGESPFLADSFDEILERNRECKVDFSALQGASREAVDLLQRLLEPNPKKRLSAAEALRHKFLTQYVECPTFEEDYDDIPEDTQHDNYSAFENMKKFQQEKFQLKKLKHSILVQQTPMMLSSGSHAQQTQYTDSWINEESPQVRDQFKIIASTDKDSDSSIWSSPLSTDPDSRASLKLGPVVLKAPQGKQNLPSQTPPTSMTKIATQVRNQLKRLDF